MTEAIDRNGNVHGDDGRYVSLRDYVERIFDERETSTEFARAALERAVVEAKVSTERAMAEAKANTDAALESAKLAADERNLVMQKRIETLESGGAPFASRLDDGLRVLKQDVETLKTEAVRVSALEGVRTLNSDAIAAQRKQIKLMFVAATINLLFSGVLAVVLIVIRH